MWQPTSILLPSSPSTCTTSGYTPAVSAKNHPYKISVKDQAVQSNLLLAHFFQTEVDLEELGAQSDSKRIVFQSERGGLDDWSRLRKLLGQVLTAEMIPDDPRGKSHKHTTMDTLLRSKEGWALLQQLYLVRGELLNVWKVAGGELVVRCGDQYPFHQGVRTGITIFSREDHPIYEDDLCRAPSLRVLIDMGALPGDEVTQRSLTYQIKEGSEFHTVIETHAGVIAMTGGAAGSGRKSNVWHGREGNGMTASFDLTQLANTSTMKSAKDLTRKGFCKVFKNGSILEHDYLPGAIDVDPFEKETTIRDLAIDPAIATSGRDATRPHCSRCGVYDDEIRVKSKSLCHSREMQYKRLSTHVRKRCPQDFSSISFHHSEFDGTGEKPEDCTVLVIRDTDH